MKILTINSSILLLLCYFVTIINSSRPRPNILKRKNPSFKKLSADSTSSSSAKGTKESISDLQALISLANLDSTINFNKKDSFLSKLLVARPVESVNLINLQKLITSHFKDLGWHIELDKFQAKTPYGLKTFTNLIFTHDIKAERRLVLSAHLDSKYYPTAPDNQFVGATDSAVPCAILIDLATALSKWLDERKRRVVDLEGGEEGRETQGETLQIIFFDGEEAFKDWTATDSIYGARHLADIWSKPSHPPSATNQTPQTPLSRISHLILLDLLGALNPVIRSFYPTTGWLFDEFKHSEQTLGTAGYLWSGLKGEGYDVAKEKLIGKERSFFVPRVTGGLNSLLTGGGIGDDHLPFVEKGVPVVHIISVPFPNVWHTLADDVTAIDYDTIKAWTLIIRLTVAEYLGLDSKIASGSETVHKRSSTDL